MLQKQLKLLGAGILRCEGGLTCLTSHSSAHVGDGQKGSSPCRALLCVCPSVKCFTSGLIHFIG